MEERIGQQTEQSQGHTFYKQQSDRYRRSEKHGHKTVIMSYRGKKQREKGEE
jgi:hypothetical protein